MPELPEVEASRRIIENFCVGKRILNAVVFEDDKVFQGMDRDDFKQFLIGKVVMSARRKGKNLWLELNERPWPSIHLGMSGCIFVKGEATLSYIRYQNKKEDVWPPQFSKLLIDFEDDIHFAFTDARRFGKIRLLNDPESTPPICELGPDAFSEFPNLDNFQKMLQKRKGEIKPVLLDQKFLSGIGNWVADEVLYQSKIHPKSLISNFSKNEISEIHHSIQHVLNLSVQSNANYECFPQQWLFHSRWKKKKGEMNGHPIDFITVGGRTSAFVPSIQKLIQKQKEDKYSNKNESLISSNSNSNLIEEENENDPNGRPLPFNKNEFLSPSPISPSLPHSPSPSPPLVSDFAANNENIRPEHALFSNSQSKRKNGKEKEKETNNDDAVEGNLPMESFKSTRGGRRRSERIARMSSSSSSQFIHNLLPKPNGIMSAPIKNLDSLNTLNVSLKNRRPSIQLQQPNQESQRFGLVHTSVVGSVRGTRSLRTSKRLKQ